MARTIILCAILIINIAICHSFLFKGKSKKTTIKNKNVVKNNVTNQNQNACDCNCGKRKRETSVYDKIPCQFDKFDLDGDNYLTYDEFATNLHKLAPNPQFTDHASFISLDFNDDGMISKTEFMFSPGHLLLVKLNIMDACN
ncbi:hypothetical protein KUTeg_015568 [Tegillarca granosa]|uniref:EF-hand domain-containing protein n=1 Tax=Tegillarca granosa TaxID=220873 RepID=A0ABQ9ER22_TEGGR|nr:hypothetical protein KUTeg_015568 [Tegillarca granosa]